MGKNMKTRLKGALTTPAGKPRLWTGASVGIVTPLALQQLAKMYLAAKTAEVTTTDEVFALSDTGKTLQNVVYASPFVLAVPFLFFKKTRGVALAALAGGVVGDLIVAYWPSSSATTTATKGALGRGGVQILGGK